MVDIIFQATNYSGSRNEQSTKPQVVRLHKAGKPVNTTDQATDDTRSRNESSQPSTGARQSVERLDKGVNLISPRPRPGQSMPHCCVISLLGPAWSLHITGAAGPGRTKTLANTAAAPGQPGPGKAARQTLRDLANTTTKLT